MKYVSTRNNRTEYTFNDVFLKGLADDGGLFVPTSIIKFDKSELSKLKVLSYSDLALEIMHPYMDDFISKNELKSIINKSYSNFRVQDVVKISSIDNLKLLELFHGPTLAFKDIAMQFIGNLYDHCLKKIKKILI